MTEYSQASQWVPSGPKLDKKANVHRMLHKTKGTGNKSEVWHKVLLSLPRMAEY